ncbi:MAG: hypothetical protein KTR32_08440 [Granulosicoccus sp.]|nr:hypothetical protein [Granulosicoccus sp.]
MNSFLHNRIRNLWQWIENHAAALAIAILLAMSPMASSALEFQCEIPGDVRYLKVNIPGEDRLCEVRVKYEYNGQDKVVWYADNDTTFCTTRAYELREKYENTWNYTCVTWPDRDGIDNLSPAQRNILDQQLKAMIQRGKDSDTPFKVTAVKAVASTDVENTPGLMSLQFFTDTKVDYTEIIIDSVGSWNVMTTVQNLASQVESKVPLASALIHGISDTGALEVRTTAVDELQHNCFGSQVLSVAPNGDLVSKTPHQIVCHETIKQQKQEG